MLNFPDVRAMSRNELTVLIAATAGSLWLLSKVLRALIAAATPSTFPGEENTVMLATPRPKALKSTPDEINNVRQYDYIIVGTGTAGAVLAARLSEDPKISVLAIEAGFSDLKQLYSRVPATASKLWRTACDWSLKTVAQPGCGGREMHWPRGKMLGGCSSINAMVFNKGAPDDFDEWEKLGNKGWSYKDVFPYMKKSETFDFAAEPELTTEEAATHGRDGPWQIGHHWILPLVYDLVKSATTLGFNRVRDFNTEKGTNGVGRFQTFIDKKGQRSSTATAYLTDDVLRRKNLRVAVGQTVTKIHFKDTPSGPQAVGVEMSSNAIVPIKYLVRAKREVIICNGAIHSPQLLKVSGIGPAAELKQHDIPLIKDLPAVGENLVDHLVLWVPCEVKGGSAYPALTPPGSLINLAKWFATGDGPLTDQFCSAAAFCRSVDREDAPESLRKNDQTSGPTSSDLELILAPLVLLNHDLEMPPKGHYASVAPVMLRPTSRGNITLTSASPFDPPKVDPRYYSTQHDIDFMLWATRLAIKIMATETFKPNFKAWWQPSTDMVNISDKELVDFIRTKSETLYHPMCSARMGNDPKESVVDAELRVHGVQGLRIVDASVFAAPLACHPCSGVVTVAEKAADLIKASQK